MSDINENELYKRLFKIKDFTLPDLIAINETAETCIREITRGYNTRYIYIIRKQEKDNSINASIEYDQLKEVIEILFFLNSKTEYDSSTSYMENMWIVNGGCEIGNYVRDNKITWYIDLKGDKNTKRELRFEEAETLCKAFIDAKKLIEKLKEQSIEI